MSDYLNEIHAAKDEIRRVAYTLEGLAAAFRMTGNSCIASRMEEYANRLLEAEKSIGDAVTKELSRALTQAEQSSLNVVQAALAAATKAAQEQALVGTAFFVKGADHDT